MADTVESTFEYVGSWQQPIPTALVLDPRLLPSEKIVWMVIRVTQMRPGAAITTTYDFLAQASGLSRPTLSKALKALQLTGWLRAHRRSTAGWVESTRYLMFDSDNSLPYVKSIEFQEFATLCLCQSNRLREVVSAVAKKFSLMELLEASSKKSELPSSKKILLPENPGSKVFLPPENVDFSSSKEFLLPRTRGSGSSSSVNDTTASVRAAGARELVWPNASAQTKSACGTDLALLPGTQAQEILDEFSAALARGGVRNATVFLRALIQSAIAGKFIYSDAGADVAAKRMREPLRPTSTLIAPPESDEDRARNHAAYVRQMQALGMRIDPVFGTVKENDDDE
jgi:hypothetical protein